MSHIPMINTISDLSSITVTNTTRENNLDFHHLLSQSVSETTSMPHTRSEYSQRMQQAKGLSSQLMQQAGADHLLPLKNGSIIMSDLSDISTTQVSDISHVKNGGRNVGTEEAFSETSSFLISQIQPIQPKNGLLRNVSYLDSLTSTATTPINGGANMNKTPFSGLDSATSSAYRPHSMFGGAAAKKKAGSRRPVTRKVNGDGHNSTPQPTGDSKKKSPTGDSKTSSSPHSSSDSSSLSSSDVPSPSDEEEKEQGASTVSTTTSYDSSDASDDSSDAVKGKKQGRSGHKWSGIDTGSEESVSFTKTKYITGKRYIMSETSFDHNTTTDVRSSYGGKYDLDSEDEDNLSLTTEDLRFD